MQIIRVGAAAASRGGIESYARDRECRREWSQLGLEESLQGGARCSLQHQSFDQYVNNSWLWTRAPLDIHNLDHNVSVSFRFLSYFYATNIKKTRFKLLISLTLQGCFAIYVLLISWYKLGDFQ